MNEKNITCNVEYKKWIVDLKAKVRQVQLKAAVTINQQLLKFYWDLELILLINIDLHSDFKGASSLSSLRQN